MALRTFDWKRWLDRALTVAAIAMIAWVGAKYLLPTSGEAINGEALSFLPAGQPALLEFSATT